MSMLSRFAHGGWVWLRFLPFLAVLGPLPFLYNASLRVIGVPVSLIWLFLCIPLTTLCLFMADRQSREPS